MKTVVTVAVVLALLVTAGWFLAGTMAVSVFGTHRDLERVWTEGFRANAVRTAEWRR